MKQQWKKCALWIAVLTILLGAIGFASFATETDGAEPSAPSASETTTTTAAPDTETTTTTAAPDAETTTTTAAPTTAPECEKSPTGKHDWGSWIPRNEGSCTVPLVETRYCNYCRQEDRRETGGTGHDYKATVVAPTCTEGGYTLYRCDECGDNYRGDETLALGHDNKETVIQKGSCTEDRIVKVECNRCDYKDTVTTKAAGHDYKEEVIAPTCTESGYTKYSCKNCPDKKEGDMVPPLGHKIKIDEEVAPTCQKEGKTERRYCEREGCGEVFLESKPIKKIDHHRITTTPVAPTCTEPGESGKEYCDMCDTVFQEPEVTPATGHDYREVVITPATCTAEGLSRETCLNCDETHTVVTSALGHDYDDDWIVEATCTDAGIRVRTCKRCGTQTDKENVAALGHDLEKDWTIDKEPTCTASGSKSYHCVRCGKRYDVTTVPKNGHSYQITVKPATTKKDGTKTYVCSVCGKTVTKVVYKIASIALNKTSFTCDNKAKTPTVIVKNTADKKLTKGTDYKVTYEKGRKKVGAYTVTVTFIGDYKGSKTLKFTIKLAKTTGVTVKSVSGHKVKVSYDKVKGAQKYCIYYATSKDGKYQKLVNNTKLSYTTKALKAGKTYYFKVRAVAQDANGNNKFGAYSAISKMKVK